MYKRPKFQGVKSCWRAQLRLVFSSLYKLSQLFFMGSLCTWCGSHRRHWPVSVYPAGVFVTWWGCRSLGVGHPLPGVARLRDVNAEHLQNRYSDQWEGHLAFPYVQKEKKNHVCISLSICDHKNLSNVQSSSLQTSSPPRERAAAHFKKPSVQMIKIVNLSCPQSGMSLTKHTSLHYKHRLNNQTCKALFQTLRRDILCQRIRLSGNCVTSSPSGWNSKF